jgi:xyloglucan galactosyltransferase MUR3
MVTVLILISYLFVILLGYSINEALVHGVSGHLPLDDSDPVSSLRRRLDDKKDSPTHGLFYIYDLAEEYWWRWPNPGTDCESQGYLSHTHAEFSGLGPAIRPDSGLFLTWHFSLFSSLFNRLKRSRRRTYDPEKATLFIIPYDLGLDGYADKGTCRNRRTCTPGLAPRLAKYIEASKYYRRYDGVDHVVLWSLGQYHPWPHNGCDTFMSKTCAKCAMTCYWMDSTKADSRFISVPFPSGYHWWDGIKDIPWAVNASLRNMTAVYLGSTQTLNPAHTKIRRAMTQQCTKSSECHWMQIGHSSIDTNIADYLSVYRRSIFCLCPPGDDPARKALFDAILSGCIPVVFQVATLFNQYWWHIGEQSALDISVYIPGEQVRAGTADMMKILLAIPNEVIQKKQAAIARIAPRVQYAMPPMKYLQNISDATPWDPPFSDGVDVLLDGLLTRLNNIQSNLSSNLPPKLLSGREWGQLYNSVRIQEPDEILKQPLVNILPSKCIADNCLVLPSKFKKAPTPAIVNSSSEKPPVTTIVKKPVTAAIAAIRSAEISHMKANWSYQPSTKQTEKLFYVYELNEEYWWSWPDPTADCASYGYLSNKHALYSGMGPPVLPDSGLFLTWHFSMFSSIYNRLKRSRRRTLDPNQASLFIIPYDLALDGSVDKKTCKNKRQCSPGLAPRLSKYLLQSPYFARHQGVDHVVLWSLGQYHPWPYNGCDVFMGDICQKCAITSYWMDAKKADSRFVSVPFPSGYHWWDGIKDIPWAINASLRNMTAVYLGSTHTLNPTHTKIRRTMVQQCQASSHCQWIQLGHSSTDNNIASLLTVYRHAVFCLCPPGDDPARKALFDAILSGCIPVTFELNTLINQYPWHIGEVTALDISVHIPGNNMKSEGKDLMSVLLAIPADVIRMKQELIAKIAPRLQYAMPPLELLKNRADETSWDPPFPDAVDAILDGLFERSHRIKNNMSSGIPPRPLSGREWARLYDMVRVKVPGDSTGFDFSTGLLSDVSAGTASTGSHHQPRQHHHARHGNHTGRQHKISHKRHNSHQIEQ